MYFCSKKLILHAKSLFSAAKVLHFFYTTKFFLKKI